MGRDLPGAGAPALVGGGQAPAGRRDVGAGRDGARGRPAARRQPEPALRLAQALPAPRSVAPAPRVPGFAAVAIAPPVSTMGDTPEAPSGLIEIELAGGDRVRISGAADPAVVAAALRALAGR